jgi:hypothetical protein
LRQVMGAALGEQPEGGFQDAVADVHLVMLPNGEWVRYRLVSPTLCRHKRLGSPKLFGGTRS